MDTTRTSSPYFSPNKRLRADPAGVVGRHDPRLHRAVLADEVVHLALHPVDFLGAQRLAVAEVEAQPVGRVEAAPLRDMIPKGTAQRLVQQMRGGVVGADP